MGQNETTRGPQVFVLGSIYQGFILGTYSSPTATSSLLHCPPPPPALVAGHVGRGGAAEAAAPAAGGAPAEALRGAGAGGVPGPDESLAFHAGGPVGWCRMVPRSGTWWCFVHFLTLFVTFDVFQVGGLFPEQA